MTMKTLVVAGIAALSLSLFGLAVAEEIPKDAAEAALQVEAQKVKEAEAAVAAGAHDAMEKIEEAQEASFEAKKKQEAAGE